MSGNREHADTIRDYFDRAFEKDDEDNRACFAALDALVAENAQLRGALEPLVDACEAEFVGDEVDDWDDDEEVASPSSHITFGLIRRARAALAEGEADRG